MEKLRIGQLWWDKDREWCDGSNTLDVCYLILSADYNYDNPGDKTYYWRCAFFMWAGDGYCGANERFFTEKEIRKMKLVGDISQIKKFRVKLPGKE